jgi:ABC-2 type transport system permease protein
MNKSLINFKRNYIGLKAIVKDEIKRFLKIWPQTLMAPTINMLLYLVVFSSFTKTYMDGIFHLSYMQFIAPGLIMMAVITNAYGNVSFSLWSHRSQGCIEELIISPLPNYLILIGYSIGGILRSILVGLMVTIMALLFTHLTLSHLAVTLIIVILTATLFSLAGFMNAICAEKFDDILFFPTFILTPLTFLGGIFYSVSTLPVFWQNISKANPIFYIIDTFRFGMLDISDTNIYFSLIFIILAVISLFFINLYLMKKGISLHK